MVEDCDLVGQFGIVVQSILSVLVVFVLSAEWLVERFIFKSHQARNFYDFWFDAFKICVGALLSHGINVLVAVWLKEKTDASDSCTLYGLSYYYEATGVAFVSLLQYCLVKYSQSKAVNSFPRNQNWRLLSRPGKYPPPQEAGDGYESRNDEVMNGHKFVLWPFDRDTGALRQAEQRCRSTFLKSFLVAIFLGVLAAVVSEDVILGLGICFAMTLFIFSFLASPWSCTIQIIAWTSLKLFEKSIWALFVMMQTQHFADWSENMEIEDKHLETWLYVAIMPMILNVFMFLMFSNISRLKIPCLELKQQGAKEGYSWKEALKLGVVYSGMINFILWAIACVLIGDGQAAGVLFATMVLLPMSVGAVFVLFFTKCLMRNSKISRGPSSRNYMNFDNFESAHTNITYQNLEATEPRNSIGNKISLQPAQDL